MLAGYKANYPKQLPTSDWPSLFIAHTQKMKTSPVKVFFNVTSKNTCKAALSLGRFLSFWHRKYNKKYLLRSLKSTLGPFLSLTPPQSHQRLDSLP